MTSSSRAGRGAVVEPGAVARGAAVAVAVCLPLALLGRAMQDGDGSPLAALLFLGVLAGLAAGGAVAARAAGDVPFTNGGLAALLAYVAIQGTALVVSAFTDGDAASVPSLVFNALLAYGCGVAGSAVVGRRARRAST